ncbi:MAG: hypothetical protein FWE13_00450 [Firmicutes bacterium]|nr:hypothetical protein [Bacillota bacterium]
MTKQKLAKILAFTALGFIGVFTVTLVMSFVNFGGTTVFIIMLVSGLVGIVLFATTKFLTKEKVERGNRNDGEKVDDVFAPLKKPPKDGEAELLD